MNEKFSMAPSSVSGMIITKKHNNGYQSRAKVKMDEIQNIKDLKNNRALNAFMKINNNDKQSSGGSALGGAGGRSTIQSRSENYQDSIKLFGNHLGS